VDTGKNKFKMAEVLELLKKEKSGKFAAGTSWSYSNSGYVLLGLISVKSRGLPMEISCRREYFATENGPNACFSEGEKRSRESGLRAFE